LKESGLSEKEAAVYLAALALGPAPVLRIAKNAGINRATTYSIIDSLITLGLMRIEERGLKRVFIAESPANLRQVMEQKMQRVEQVVPDLMKLYKAGGKASIIHTYDGLSAARNVYEQIMREFRSADFFYFIGGSLGWSKVDVAEQERYFKWRSRIRFEAKLIFQDSERAKLHKTLSGQLNQQVKTFPQEIALESDIIITPRMVAILRLSPPPATLIIEDLEIVHSYKALFTFMWNSIPESTPPTRR